jgi:hypothetical protein
MKMTMVVAKKYHMEEEEGPRRRGGAGRPVPPATDLGAAFLHTAAGSQNRNSQLPPSPAPHNVVRVSLPWFSGVKRSDAIETRTSTPSEHNLL